MTGTAERDEESVFLFVQEAATVYLFGEQNWEEKQAEIDIDAALYLLMSPQIAHSLGCHVVCYDVLLMLSFSPNNCVSCDIQFCYV